MTKVLVIDDQRIAREYMENVVKNGEEELHKGRKFKYHPEPGYVLIPDGKQDKEGKGDGFRFRKQYPYLFFRNDPWRRRWEVLGCRYGKFFESGG